MSLIQRTAMSRLPRRREKRDFTQLQQIELPHDCNGEVDWKTLGNILAAHLMGEVLCASYVDHKYGRRCDFLPDTDWEFAYEERDVVVLQKRLKDSPIHCFMGRGVIDLPMENVVSFVGSLQTRKQWDRYLVEIREAKKFSETDHLVYMFHRAKECLVRAEREFLYFNRMTYVDGKYVHSSLSVDHPDFPPTHGVTRAQILPGSGWVIEPYEGSTSRTLASYLAHLDLVGLPALITNRVMRRQPMAIHYIRNILAPSTPGIERWPDISIASAPAAPHSHLSNCSDSVRSHYYEQPLSVTAFTGVPRPYSVPTDINRLGNEASYTHFQTHTHSHGVWAGADTGLSTRLRVTSEPDSLNTIARGSPSSHGNGINVRSPAFLRPLEKSHIPNGIKTEATGPLLLGEEVKSAPGIENSRESTPRATSDFEPQSQYSDPSATANSASFFNTQSGKAEGVNDLTYSAEGDTTSEDGDAPRIRSISNTSEKTPEPLQTSRDSTPHIFFISSGTGSSKRSSTIPEPPATGSTLQPALLQNSATETHRTTNSGRLSPTIPTHCQDVNGITNSDEDGSGSPGLLQSSDSFHTAQEGSYGSTPEGLDGEALRGQTDSKPSAELLDHVGKQCPLGSSFSDLKQPGSETSATSEKFNVMISL